MSMPSLIPDTAPLCAGPDPHPHKSTLDMPALACDCHAHICGPMASTHYIEERLYTPPDALLPRYQSMLTTLGLARAVLVQPSIYGTDNEVLLAALQQGGGAYRGVAVVSPSIGDQELTRLAGAGIRGIRINIVDVQEGRNVVPIDLLRQLARRIASLGWHIELLMQVDAVADLETLFADLPVDIVLGHLGYMHAARGDRNHPGFSALLRLLERGKCWVKLTGPYRISAEELPYADVRPFARALIECAPNRLVWGTDWPHVMVKKQMPNDGDLLNLLGDWTQGDAALQKLILAENPAMLYGFQ
jgi:2-pyrone-4,6-dicarboxylate lactonase